MPTVVTKSIGTSGRDYSTLQAWIDACPADLVSADEVWRGECYNDSEFSVNAFNTLVISGISTDGTRFVELTAATGESFQDHASVRTNPLTYDQSKGVGITNPHSYATGINCGFVNSRISRLQVKLTHSTSAFAIAQRIGILMKDCLADCKGGTGGTATNDANVQVGENGLAVNVLLIARSAASRGFSFVAATTAIGCTVVKPTDYTDSSGRPAYNTGYDSNVVTNCAAFGFPTFCHGSGTFSGDYNATDLSSGAPGAHSVHSVPYTSTTPFVLATEASTDLRAIAGTLLAAAGTLDSTNAPNDISGHVRANPPTIGVWEVVASASIFSPVMALVASMGNY